MLEKKKHKSNCCCDDCREREYGHRAILGKTFHLDENVCFVITLHIDTHLVDRHLISFLKEHFGNIDVLELSNEYRNNFCDGNIRVGYSEVKKIYAHKPSLFESIQNTNPDDIEIDDDCELVDVFED